MNAAGAKGESGKSGSRESQHPCGLEPDGKSGKSRERVGNLSQSLTLFPPFDLAPELAPAQVPQIPREVHPAPAPKFCAGDSCT